MLYIQTVCLVLNLVMSLRRIARLMSLYIGFWDWLSCTEDSAMEWMRFVSTTMTDLKEIDFTNDDIYSSINITIPS